MIIKKILIWSGVGLVLGFSSLVLVLMKDTNVLEYRPIIRARGDVETLSHVVDLYKSANNQYPKSLVALTPKYIKRIVSDPWGGEYVFLADSDGFTIYSAGKNGIDESQSGDDVIVGPKQYSCEVYRINCPYEFVDYAKFVSGTIFLLSAIVFILVSVMLVLSRLYKFRKK